MAPESPPSLRRASMNRGFSADRRRETPAAVPDHRAGAEMVVAAIPGGCRGLRLANQIRTVAPTVRRGRVFAAFVRSWPKIAPSAVRGKCASWSPRSRHSRGRLAVVTVVGVIVAPCRVDLRAGLVRARGSLDGPSKRCAEVPLLRCAPSPAARVDTIRVRAAGLHSVALTRDIVLAAWVSPYCERRWLALAIVF